MDSARKLNVDIPGSVSKLQAILRDFKLKKQKIVFRGKGLEFDGYRNFGPDDDAKEIDWKSSLRTQKLLVKKYKEERDRKVMFLVDVGSNMVFGSTEKIKCEFATELIAGFADLVIHSEDRVGFFLFSDSIRHVVKCKPGKKHFLFFMDILSDGLNYGGQTNLDQAIDFAMGYFDKSINSIILISDFLNFTKETEKKITLLANKFETIVIQIRDPLDITLPEINGEVTLENALTSKQIIVNPKIAKKSYEKYVSEKQKIIRETLEKSGADYLDLITDKSFAPPLAIFLKRRIENK